MNFVAELCEATGADVDLVRRGIGADHRIGADGLRPGPGFGGACLPQDLEALIQVSQAHGITADLLEAVRDINARQPLRILARVREMLDGRLDGRAIAVWGLAFKAGTDDIRESPAVRFIEGLLDAGAVVRAYDPRARWGAEQAFGERIRYSNDPYAVLDGADALVVMTEWEAFRAPDFDRVRKLLRLPVVVDARNLFEPSAMRRMGFRYAGVGRGGES
jgi:UDPglucose 6-dehydrogenase